MDVTDSCMILLNLLSNAIKFTPGGWTVSVAAEVRGCRGAWSEPGVRAKIFEPFEQERHPEDTGLGMAITKKYRGMGGTRRRAKIRVYHLPAHDTGPTSLEGLKARLQHLRQRRCRVGMRAEWWKGGAARGMNGLFVSKPSLHVRRCRSLLRQAKILP